MGDQCDGGIVNTFKFVLFEMFNFDFQFSDFLISFIQLTQQNFDGISIRIAQLFELFNYDCIVFWMFEAMKRFF